MAPEKQLALTEVGTNEVEIMKFFLDLQDNDSEYKGFYGVNVAKVLKILRMPDHVMTPPETSHPSVLGMFLYKDRNQVIPLIGLAKYLNELRIPNDNQKIIITEFNQIITGFLVSGVVRIHRLSWSDVSKPDKLTDEFSQNAFTGIVKLDGDVVFILDLEKIVIELNPSTGDAFFSADTKDIEVERQVNILHVDDQVVVRKMVKRSLEQNPMFVVDSAESGQDALEKLHAKLELANAEGKSLRDYVDVVITDVEMPVMDGFTLCKNITNTDVFSEIPVYLFSSLITDETKHRGASVGAAGQFAKPQTEGMAQEIMLQLAEKCATD